MVAEFDMREAHTAAFTTSVVGGAMVVSVSWGP